MSNYSIIINSKFKPFSYAEMLAPVLESTLAHQLVEEAYSALSTLAESIAAKANEQTDPKAYARYKAYAELLLALAENLARNGLTPDSRRSMFRMRDLYAKQILPIQEAILKRKEMSDLQLRTLMANPTMLFGKKAATTSLDEFLDNPNIDFSQLYSGALLTEQVAKQASALANELQSYGKGKSVDPYTYTFLKRYGFTRAEVLKAISDPNSLGSSRVLSAIVDSVLQSSGVPQWADLATMERARAYANQGLWSAIGKADVAPMENYGARKQLEAALLDRNNARAAARAARASRGGGRHSGGSSGGYALLSNAMARYPNLPLNLKPRDIRVAGSGKNKRIGDMAMKNLGIKVYRGKDGRLMKLFSTINLSAGEYTKYTKDDLNAIRNGSNPQLIAYNRTKLGIKDNRFKASLWYRDNNGNVYMKSRDHFIALGKTKAQKDALRDYYDKEVKNGLKAIGRNPNTLQYSSDYIASSMHKFINKTEDLVTQAYAMRFKDSNRQDVVSLIGDVIESAGGMWELNSDNNTNSSKLSGRKISYGTFRHNALLKNSKDDEKGTYSNDLRFYHRLTEGQEGLIVKLGEKYYYVPLAKMSNSPVLRNGYLSLNSRKDPNLGEAYRRQLEAISMSGSLDNAIREAEAIGDYNTANYFGDAKFYIDNATVGAISSIGDDMLGSYKLPDFDIAKQADSDGDTKIDYSY